MVHRDRLFPYTTEELPGRVWCWSGPAAWLIFIGGGHFRVQLLSAAWFCQANRPSPNARATRVVGGDGVLEVQCKICPGN